MKLGGDFSFSPRPPRASGDCAPVDVGLAELGEALPEELVFGFLAGGVVINNLLGFVADQSLHIHANQPRVEKGT